MSYSTLNELTVVPLASSPITPTLVCDVRRRSHSSASQPPDDQVDLHGNDVLQSNCRPTFYVVDHQVPHRGTSAITSNVKRLRGVITSARRIPANKFNLNENHNDIDDVEDDESLVGKRATVKNQFSVDDGRYCCRRCTVTYSLRTSHSVLSRHLAHRHSIHLRHRSSVVTLCEVNNHDVNQTTTSSTEKNVPHEDMCTTSINGTTVKMEALSSSVTETEMPSVVVVVEEGVITSTATATTVYEVVDSNLSSSASDSSCNIRINGNVNDNDVDKTKKDNICKVQSAEKEDHHFLMEIGLMLHRMSPETRDYAKLKMREICCHHLYNPQAKTWNF